MRTISATMSMTLDGVVQGLGRPDEDTRGGFRHGGWGTRYTDEVMMAEMGQGMAAPSDMLFGRRTWQDFIGAWAHQSDGNPFTAHLNAVRKYVVSTTLDDAAAWQNSVLLAGDARGVGDCPEGDRRTGPGRRRQRLARPVAARRRAGRPVRVVCSTRWCSVREPGCSTSPRR